MFDIINNIKVGMAVVFKEGSIGYITSVEVKSKLNEYVCIKGNFLNETGTWEHNNTICGLAEHFKQIGTYKFDDEENKNEIGKLNYASITMDNGLMYTKDKMMIDKINEIIDYLNKE